MNNIDEKFNKVGKVLLVNDDGIDAPGFKILKSIAEEISEEIWVFAPKNDKSGAGRSITPVSYTHLTLPTTPYV